MLAFARLLGEQDSRWPPGRVACGAAVPTSMRSACGRRVAQQRGVHEVIVEHDIGRLRGTQARAR